MAGQLRRAAVAARQDRLHSLDDCTAVKAGHIRQRGLGGGAASMVRQIQRHGGDAAVSSGQVRIHNMNIGYSVVHRSIKYPRLEFKTGGLLLVLPRGHNGHKLLIEKHREWIYKKSVQISVALEQAQERKLELSRTEGEFRRTVRLLSEKISGELGVCLNKIYFRRMKSKWGSCSSSRNLTVNTLLRYLPEDLVEYVIFHELAHLIERKHNGRFWRIISAKFENHGEKESGLFEYWFSIQKSGLTA